METTIVRLTALMFIVLGVSLTAQRGGGQGPSTGSGQAGTPNPVEGQPAAIEEGRQIFNKTCTVCHGLDGGAGEMGPALGLEVRRSATRNAAEIFDVIKNGIPATGMPASADLTNDDIWKVTAYLQALRGTAIDAPAPGNVASGEAIFWGKAECVKCHMVRGKGGILGPELSAIADLRKTASIVDALTNPRYRVQGDGGAIPRKLEPPNDYRVVRVTTPDGKVIRGVVKNENSVSLQILGVDDSRLHLLDRTKLRAISSTRRRA